MRRAQLAEAVVEGVQVLDEQVPPRGQVRVTKQGLQVGQRRRLHAPAPGRLALALALALQDGFSGSRRRIREQGDDGNDGMDSNRHGRP